MAVKHVTIPRPNIAWTRFHDAHTGVGGRKTPYEFVYIQADEAEAIRRFVDILGTDPTRSSCHCCGPDFNIETLPSLQSASEWERGVQVVDGRDVPYRDEWYSVETWAHERDDVLVVYIHHEEA